MKKLIGVFLSLAALSFAVRPATGELETMEELSVDFTDASPAAVKAEWSDDVNANEHGLGFAGDATAIRDGWIMTKPLAVGTAWRPEIAASVRVQVKPAPLEVKFPNGTSTSPQAGTMYVRYSPDRKHWSTWQAMEGEAVKPGMPQLEFHGGVQVPQREQRRYLKRIQEYAGLDVPWAADQEAAVRWIVGREPNFFDTELPIVGYVQILYELDFYGGQRLQSLVVQTSGGVGGVHQPPKDPSEYDKHNGPWRYVAP